MTIGTSKTLMKMTGIPMLNKVEIIGRLSRDPEVKQTSGGTSVATLTIPTERKWTTKEGEKKSETEWHQLVFWDRNAEIAGQYLVKGSLLYVEGHLKTRSWVDPQTGEKRFRTEIICDSFKMLGGRPQQQTAEGKASVTEADIIENDDPFDTENW